MRKVQIAANLLQSVAFQYTGLTAPQTFLIRHSSFLKEKATSPAPTTGDSFFSSNFFARTYFRRCAYSSNRANNNVDNVAFHHAYRALNNNKPCSGVERYEIRTNFQMNDQSGTLHGSRSSSIKIFCNRSFFSARCIRCYNGVATRSVNVIFLKTLGYK